MASRRKPAQSKTARARGGASSKNLAGAGAKIRRSPSQPFENALKAVVRLISALEQPAAIIGGIAVIAHGFARATGDIDLAVVALPDQVPQLLRAATSAGFRARIRDAASFAQKNYVLLLEHVSTGVPVDLSLALQDFERRALTKPVSRKLGAVTVPVAPLTALLIYKMVASRPKDVDDVLALLATRASFDRRAVELALAEIDALLETNRNAEFSEMLKRSNNAR